MSERGRVGALAALVAAAWAAGSAGAPAVGGGVAECDGAYYGIDRAPDLGRAAACYEAAGAYAMALTMALNGEGGPRTPERVEGLFRAWERADKVGVTEGLEAGALQQIAGDWQRSKIPPKHLDFCVDVAGDTAAVEACAALANRRGAAKLGTLRAALEKGLRPDARAALAKLDVTFAAFAKAESARTFWSLLEGSIRGVAALGQEGALRDDYAARLKLVVGDRRLEPATPAQAKAALQDLGTAIDRDIATFADTYAELLKDAAQAESWPAYRAHIKDYGLASAAAASAWEAYRKAWDDVVTALCQEPHPIASDAAAYRAGADLQLAHERVAQLHRDPSGG